MADRRRWRAHACASRCASTSPARCAGRLEVEAPAGWPAVAPVAFALEAGRDSRAYDLRLARRRARDRRRGGGGARERGARRRRRDDRRRSAGRVPAHPRGAVAASVRPSRCGHSSSSCRSSTRSATCAAPPTAFPRACSKSGVPLRLLSGEQILDLGDGGLDRFDAIVLGSRAYEADERLGEANQRLLDYVRGGGLLIVQYQQYDFVQRGCAPFPITIARPHDRITDEESPVEALAGEQRRAATPARDRRRRLGGLGPGARPLLRATPGTRPTSRCCA